MIFNLVILLLLLGIAYYHWIEGLFSSVISMVLAIVASMLAVGLHETIIVNYLGGRMADYAHGLVTAGIFSIVYIGGRVAFDMLVPGNVRVPFLMDKIGGAACGLVAAIFSLGTLALSVQMMPFYSSIMFFDRFESLEPGNDGRGPDLQQPTGQGSSVRVESTKFADTIKVDEKEIDAGFGAGLWVPVDQWVQGFAGFQSEKGALGSSPMTRVHPNLVMQLYNQRLGVLPSNKRTVMNVAGKEQFKVLAAYQFDTLPQLDAEFRNPGEQKNVDVSTRPKEQLFKQETLKPAGDQTLLVLRVEFTSDAAERPERVSTDVVFLSPGSVRLVAGSGDTRRNYYPVGTLYRGSLLSRNRRDDPIFIDVAQQNAQAQGSSGDGPRYAELVFLVSKADAVQGGKLAPDTFVEAKRLGYVDLAGKDVLTALGQKRDRIFSPVDASPRAAGQGTPVVNTDPVVRKSGWVSIADEIIAGLGDLPTSEAEAARSKPANAAKPK
jgi:hypothetical protein